MHPLLAAGLANSLSRDRVGAARSRRTAKAAKRAAAADPRPPRSSSGARPPPTPRRSLVSASWTATGAPERCSPAMPPSMTC